MKVICDRGVLADALGVIQGVVISRTPKPVLLCVKVVAENGVLTLSGTDLEVAIHLQVDQVDVQAEGQVLVPVDKLLGIVRESVDPTITIEADAEAANIIGADSHFKVFGHAPQEFPPIEAFGGEADFEISAVAFKQLIHQTIFATARETSRYAINGVLLERDGKKLTMVATDGRRLAHARSACSKGSGQAASAIVPTKALTLLQKLLVDDDEVVRVKIDANQAHVATGRGTLVTNLVEGNFPPYKDVIPKDQTTKTSFKTTALVSGVRRAALLTNEESKGVRFNFGAEELVLSSRAPEMGESEVKVPAESMSGDPVEIGFNPHFLADVLKVVEAETVAIDLKASNKPGVVRVGSDFLYVVMPVSLG